MKKKHWLNTSVWFVNNVNITLTTLLNEKRTLSNPFNLFNDADFEKKSLETIFQTQRYRLSKIDLLPCIICINIVFFILINVLKEG